MWLVKIRRDERTDVANDHPEYFKVTDSTKICSAHFKPEDYCPGDRKRADKKTDISRRNLNRRAKVFPSIFAWTDSNKPKRKEPAVRSAPPPATRKKVETKIVEESPVAACGGSEDDVLTLPGESSSTLVGDSSGGVSRGVCEADHDCSCFKKLQDKLELADAKLEELQTRYDALEQEKYFSNPTHPSAMSYDRIKQDHHLVNYYSGFSSALMFMACFNFLHQAAQSMRLWKGSASAPEDRSQEGQKRGPKPKLSLVDQFLLVTMRLRLGLGEVDLAFRFEISQSTVSRLVTSWVSLMYHKFKQLPVWLPRRTVNSLMPPCFKVWYPTTRVVIDCTEFFIQTPTSLARQSATWSNYKSHNTVKVLIGIAPHGHVTFVSDAYEGSISDKAITESSGLITLLEAGDSVMADKGFEIKDLLLDVGVRLNIPPFKSGDRQMAPEDLLATKKIAAVRIHVERKMQRIKAYKILAGNIENTLFDHIHTLVFVCAMLTNFEGALVA
ncbi:uncharacterized protein LOC135816882 [Sycon ciliatum]|uniref:uncharacterized protein LOC135816882 n=1 Tax=Sycon ciliatum TaxID=27933 RepID=UPI0031F5F355